MRKYITFLLAVILLLTGCQQIIPNVSDPIPDVDDPGPPFGIQVNSVEELNQLREVVESRDEKKLQEAARKLSSKQTVESIVTFVNILDTLPVLKILDGEITGIQYTWREDRHWDASGEQQITEKSHEIVYITTEAADGSWVRLTYSHDNKDKPIEEILDGFDLRNSLLNEPFWAVNDRVYVFYESREVMPPSDGSFVFWSTVVDGLPVRVTYYINAKESRFVEAESVFQNTTIGLLP